MVAFKLNFLWIDMAEKNFIGLRDKLLLAAALAILLFFAGLSTIAEFVEDEQALAITQAIGIDYAQGYAVAEPALFDDSYYIASRDLE